MFNFNPLAARLFVAALRHNDVDQAILFATDVTSNPELVNSSTEPEQVLVGDDLADFVEMHLGEMDKGLVNMTWNVHIPAVIGAVAAWLENQLTETEDGKADSQSSGE